MSNILIVHIHWRNRGDEAANRAMVDEICRLQPDTQITVQFAADEKAGPEAFYPSGVKVLSHRFPHAKDLVEIFCIYISKGHIAWSQNGKDFVHAVKAADIVVHAPGGPSIGDIYSQSEFAYLCRLLFALRLKKPVFIYAPSMGPFENKARNILRKYVLQRACRVTFREKISAEYFHKLLPGKEYRVTLDSAFQNDINVEQNKAIMEKDTELCKFLNRYDKVVGITITDLQWNPKYSGNFELCDRIRSTFTKFIAFLEAEGYGVIYIPQLFGNVNDRDYMETFSTANTFLLSDKYDCYFQQHLISKLYVVVGMRYHSNIFSCKMGTPFISISYEQKMKGFMREQGLEYYCLEVSDLNYDNLIKKFTFLVSNYDSYRNTLKERKDLLKNKSRTTTKMLLEYIENNNKTPGSQDTCS